MRLCGLALALLTAVPAAADSQFRIAIVPRADLAPGKGQCDIRLEAGGDAQVTIRRDQVSVHSNSGAEARDGGSDCNVALPEGDVRHFTMQKVEGSGEARVIERPSERNEYAAVVRISGGGRYHLRLTWDVEAPNPAPKPPSAKQDNMARPPAPEGFIWNNAVTYRGHGAGESVVEGRSQMLANVRVDIDLGGRIVVEFTPDEPHGIRGTPRPLLFNGRVMTREPARVVASVATEDHRLFGTMTLAVDAKQNVVSAALKATNGQEHLTLTWQKR